MGVSSMLIESLKCVNCFTLSLYLSIKILYFETSLRNFPQPHSSSSSKVEQVQQFLFNRFFCLLRKCHLWHVFYLRWQLLYLFPSCSAGNRVWSGEIHAKNRQIIKKTTRSMLLDAGESLTFNERRKKRKEKFDDRKINKPEKRGEKQ